MDNGVKCKCRHCGKELEPSHTGPCPNCGKTGKNCEVTASVVVGVGVNASVVAGISKELSKEEKGLWEKLVSFFKANVVVDGFEIGFPSGVKIIFKVREKDKN